MLRRLMFGLWAVVLSVTLAACASSYRPYYQDDFDQRYGSIKDSPPERAASHRSNHQSVGRDTAPRKFAKSQQERSLRKPKPRKIASAPPSEPVTSRAPVSNDAPEPTQTQKAEARPAPRDRVASNAPTANEAPSFSAPQPASPPVVINEPAAVPSAVQTPAPVAPKLVPQEQASSAPTNVVRCPETSRTCTADLVPLLADPARSWINTPAAAKDFVSGARLVAYDRLRNDLSCRELVTAIEEAQTAVVALGAAVADETALGRSVERLADTENVAKKVRTRLGQVRTDRC